MTHRMFLGFGMVALFAAGSAAQNVVFENAMWPGGGVLRPSQLWIDPADRNDSDNDAIAWEDFRFPHRTTVTRLEWWGQALPPLGFEIGFFNQDPNTVVSQPDIFRIGAEPISERVYGAPSVEAAGSGLYKFSIDLVTPLTFEPDTRYFVSVIGRSPVFTAQWGWAKGMGAGTTFYWIRGAHMYFQLSENRAVRLSGFEELPCPADLSGSSDPNDPAYGVPDGAVDAGDFFYFLDQFVASNLSIADLTGSSDPNDASYGTPDGRVDASDFFYFLDVFVGGCS